MKSEQTDALYQWRLQGARVGGIKGGQRFYRGPFIFLFLCPPFTPTHLLSQRIF